MPPILAQIQERVGPAPKPDDIKASNLVHLYAQADWGAGAQRHRAACMTCRTGTPRLVRKTTPGLPQPLFSSSPFTRKGGLRSSSNTARTSPIAAGYAPKPEDIHAACIGHMFTLGCAKRSRKGRARQTSSAVGRCPFMTISTSIELQKAWKIGSLHALLPCPQGEDRGLKDRQSRWS
jgi:hypothetical protein